MSEASECAYVRIAQAYAWWHATTWSEYLELMDKRLGDFLDG